MKGILIIAIVIGHNRILTDRIEGLFAILYFWHVQGFFFLAFSNRGFGIGNRSIIDMVTRYMVPFLLFTTAISFGHFLVSWDYSIPEKLLILFYSGAAQWSEEATKIQLFWFLPTLSAFIVLQIIVSRALDRYQNVPYSAWALLAIFIFTLFVILPASVHRLLPWCVGLALYLMPVSAAFAAGCNELLRGRASTRSAILVAAAAAVGSTVWLVLSTRPINIAQFDFGLRIGLMPIVATGAIASAGAIGANLLVVLLAKRLAGSKLLRMLGRQSLQIYLYHIFFQYGVWVLLNRTFPNLSLILGLTAGLLASIAAVAGALAISRVINSVPRLRSLVFPKDLAGLKMAIN
jgi:fucose 4-O-acetylase-like acetyltransferase